MGRRKSYDVETVLATLTQVFWRKGYRATSLSDLEQASGLDRKSLLSEFGPKPQLFIHVLAHYLEVKAKPDGAPLVHEPPGLSNIERFFRQIRYDERQELGCLLALTVLEQESVPVEAYELACRVYVQLEQAFHTNLAPAVESGALTASSARSYAKFLLGSLHGIIVAGRAGASNSDLERVVDVILSTLPNGRRAL